MQRITTLERCNAFWYMKALQERLCEQDSSEHSAVSVNKAQSEEFIALIDYSYSQHWLGIHMESGGLFL